MLSHATLPHGLAKSTDNAATDFNRQLLQLSRRLLHDTNTLLTASTRHIGALLLDMANAKNGCSWPSYRWFKRMFGYSSSTLAKAIKVLVRLGYVVVEHRRHRSSRYWPRFAQGDVQHHQAAPEPKPEPCRARTLIIEVPPASIIEAEPPNEEPYALEAELAAPPAAETSEGSPTKDESDGIETEPNPNQREMLMAISGGRSLSPAEVTRRIHRLVQKGIAGQDADIVVQIIAHWQRLEPVLEAAVRGGGRDDDILRDVLRPALRRSSATISA